MKKSALFVALITILIFISGCIHDDVDTDTYEEAAMISKIIFEKESLDEFSDEELLSAGITFANADYSYQAIRILEQIPLEEVKSHDMEDIYYMSLAQAHFSKYHYEKARSYSQKVIEITDSNSLNFMKANLILFYISSEEKNESISSRGIYQKLQEFNPEYVDTVFLEYLLPIIIGSINEHPVYIENLEEIFLEAVNISNQDDDNNKGIQYTYLATIFCENEDYDKAKKYFDLAIEVYPAFVPIYLGYAKVFTAQGDFEKAINYYELALSFDPNNFRAHNGLGWSYYELVRDGKKDESYLELAVYHLEKCISVDKEYSRAYNTLGVVSSYKGNDEQAESYYFKALEFEEYYKPYQNLANIYMGRGDFEKVVEYADKAYLLKRKPNASTINKINTLIKLGRYYDSKKQYQKAIDEYMKAIELDEHYYLPYLLISQNYFRTGDLALAEDYINQAMGYGF